MRHAFRVSLLRCQCLWLTRHSDIIARWKRRWAGQEIIENWTGLDPICPGAGVGQRLSCRTIFPNHWYRLYSQECIGTILLIKKGYVASFRVIGACQRYFFPFACMLIHVLRDVPFRCMVWYGYQQIKWGVESTDCVVMPINRSLGSLLSTNSRLQDLWGIKSA